jgi:pterin-4a-carbinolamine dehydratase
MRRTIQTVVCNQILTNGRKYSIHMNIPYSLPYYPSSTILRHSLHFHSSTRKALSSTISSSTLSSPQNTKIRKDPTAKRPNKICDPYGQNGKPMTKNEAMKQLLLLDSGWHLDYNDIDNANDNANDENNYKADEICNSNNSANNNNSKQNDDDDNTSLILSTTPPRKLYKQFHHTNYINASKFISIISSVAYNNNHYPSLQIERQLLHKEKAWRVVSTITCYTEVLNGLSFHDFYIAMLIDVEVGSRDDVKNLIVNDEERESQ